jgi:polysaccharide pyruvyl transferase WcaK-like protein
MVSPSSGPLILVVDGWLANAGDAASYVATTRSLQHELPSARVAIAAHHRSLVGDRYPELDLVPPLDAFADVSWPWTSEEDVAERPVIEALVEKADLVLAAGGGYLLERYQPEPRIRGYEALLERGKRLAFYAQSIGKFSDPNLRARLEAVLEAAELVLLRDEHSLEIVRTQGNPQKVQVSADEAFLFPAPRRVSRPRSLLVTASPHPWERSGENELPDYSFIPEVAGALSRLLRSGLVHKVTLASTAQGLGGSEWEIEDDSELSDAIFAAIPPHQRDMVEVRHGYLTPGQYAELAAQHMALISMRMHGAILAATTGTPVLMANASDKARALSHRTDGGMKGIAERSDLARLDELVAPLLEDPGQARVRQNAAVEEMRGLARRNAKLVAERVASDA